jgi:hypothetical protein
MEKTHKRTHPITFIDGAQYLCLVQDAVGASRFTPVTFLAYTACPAFVIVSDGDRPRRCPRAELFDLENTAKWL